MGEGRAEPSPAGAPVRRRGPPLPSPPLRPRCLQPPCLAAGRGGGLRRAGAAGRRLLRGGLGSGRSRFGGAGRGAAGYAVSGAGPRSRPVPWRSWGTVPAVRGLRQQARPAGWSAAWSGVCAGAGCRVPLSAREKARAARAGAAGELWSELAGELPRVRCGTGESGCDSSLFGNR